MRTDTWRSGRNDLLRWLAQATVIQKVLAVLEDEQEA